MQYEFDKKKRTEKIAKDLEDAKLIVSTKSYWAAPSIMVKNKDGTKRIILDYRGLNKQIEKIRCSPPKYQELKTF